jgi:hypothetical protein
MSDHLLRLANVVADHIEGKVPQKILVYQCEQIVRDLEAAPQPERRTITREEFRAAQEQVWRAQDNGENAAAMLERVADVWRLTVEE